MVARSSLCLFVSSWRLRGMTVLHHMAFTFEVTGQSVPRPAFNQVISTHTHCSWFKPCQALGLSGEEDIMMRFPGLKRRKRPPRTRTRRPSSQLQAAIRVVNLRRTPRWCAMPPKFVMEEVHLVQRWEPLVFVLRQSLLLQLPLFVVVSKVQDKDSDVAVVRRRATRRERSFRLAATATLSFAFKQRSLESPFTSCIGWWKKILSPKIGLSKDAALWAAELSMFFDFNVSW